MLAERLAGGRFHVAVVGQFKRGKSTLINALLGREVLPTGVVPVTALVTVIRHGEEPGARLRAADGAWRPIPLADLAAWVSEEGNPGNAKGVVGVEVFVPSPLLASGMCLVDTPGVGSVFAGGTEATRAFVPHIDAALVVLGADPPLSEAELDLVTEVAREVRTLRFVLAKADRVPAHERQQAVEFTRRILAERLDHDPGTILEVSAREHLRGGADVADWPALVQGLTELADASGAELLRAAERRGTTLLARRLRHEIDERREALTRPLQDSEARIAELRATSADTERALHELRYLLDAEQDRLADRLAERTVAFLEQATAGAREELAGRLGEIEGGGPGFRAAALEQARAVCEKTLEAWRAREDPVVEGLYREAAQRFVDLANAFLERLAASGAPSLDALEGGLGPEVGFRVDSRLYYRPLWHYAPRGPLGWLGDVIAPRARVRHAVERDAADYLERLLGANATRVETDFEERVLESRRRLQAEVRERLSAGVRSAERALERARATRAEGAPAVQAELERLDALAERVPWRA